MIRRPPRSTLDRSSAASDVYKRQTYPNPCGQEFSVNIPAELTGNLEVKIITTSGQLIYYNILDANALRLHKFNAMAWAKGVYMIQMNQGEKVYAAEQIVK